MDAGKNKPKTPRKTTKPKTTLEKIQEVAIDDLKKISGAKKKRAKSVKAANKKYGVSSLDVNIRKEPKNTPKNVVILTPNQPTEPPQGNTKTFWERLKYLFTGNF